MKIDVLKDHFIGICSVGEIHIFKIDAAVFDFHDGVFRILQGRFFVQDFGDTSCGSRAHGHHDEDHGEHHQAHQDVHAVGQEGHQIACGEVAGHDHVGADPGDQHDAGIDRSHHDRAGIDDIAFSLYEHVVDILCGLGKLCLLIFLTDKGLDHADGGDILLDALVQIVITLEDLLEVAGGPVHDEHHNDGQEDDCCQINGGDPGADHKAHEHGRDQGDGSPHGHTQEHHVGVLDVGHVRRQPCHQSGGGEMVDVGKGEILDLYKHGFTQVPGQACGCPGSEISAADAESKAQKGHNDHLAAGGQDKSHVPCLDPVVNDLSHQDGDDHLADDLADHTDGSQYGGQFEFFDLPRNCFNHGCSSSVSSLMLSYIRSRSLFKVSVSSWVSPPVSL